MIKGYVIEVEQRYTCGNRTEILYYTGYTYFYDGLEYGSFDRIEKAKIYTSEKRAISAMNKIFPRLANWDGKRVVPLIDKECGTE